MRYRISARARYSRILTEGLATNISCLDAISRPDVRRQPAGLIEPEQPGEETSGQSSAQIEKSRLPSALFQEARRLVVERRVRRQPAHEPGDQRQSERDRDQRGRERKTHHGGDQEAADQV